MKILTVLGARPQFIKAATVSRAIAKHGGMHEVIVHTGQHFDENMSDVFFSQMDIPRPAHNLKIAGLSHGAMTGRMLEGIESLIQAERPTCVLVYGDTNSTLAGALAATKLHVPIAHIEAGLRSFNPKMPEEVNRILTDRVSSVLFCPTDTAIDNLRREGFPFPDLVAGFKSQRQTLIKVGDVMFDAVRYYRDRAASEVNLGQFNLKDGGYALCTLHRQENIDDPTRLTSILRALSQIASELPVALPLHPRARLKMVTDHGDAPLEQIQFIDPLPYLEMQRLLMGAKVVLTDSGGLQKEAYFHQIPCITLRDETEWTETVDAGANVLVGANFDRIVQAFQSIKKPQSVHYSGVFGDGYAAEAIVQELHSLFS